MCGTTSGLGPQKGPRELMKVSEGGAFMCVPG